MSKRESKKVVIIGSGPGGYYAALLLAKQNQEVTLVDRQHIGGTCLNVGCIPTKALLDHISLFEHFKDTALKKKIFEGDNLKNLKINLENLRSFQTEIIKQLAQGLEKLFKNNKINFLYGEAKLLSKTKVLVKGKDENGESEIEADEIIIGTGSRPKAVPGFNFDKNYVVSSDDIWNIPKIPEKLLVIGSGPIGIEFARVYNALGSKVTVAEIQEVICPILDGEISENLVRSLKRRGITVRPNTASKFVKKENALLTIEFLSTQNSEKTSEEFNQVLIAVGREPNTENLGLEDENLGIEQAGRFIKVNNKMQTNVENIWAIGDVTDYPQLAHTASSQARVAASNILGNLSSFNGDVIPSCIFGYPEIAFVGASEKMLKEKKINYKAGKFLFLASGKAKASGLTEGLVKILMDTNTKQILGAHIIGPEASNLIHELVVGMQNNLTVDKIAHSIHAHPTYSEVVLEALEDCLGTAVHV